jgi:hypothetical protein
MTMGEKYPAEAAKEGFNSSSSPVEHIEIKHSLGSWKVTLHSTYWTLPETVDCWNSVCLSSHRYRGHAIGQLRRLAKHSPDRDARFHIAPSINGEIRWTVYIDTENN